MFRVTMASPLSETSESQIGNNEELSKEYEDATMYISQQKLSDLCCIYIAYLMWTRRYVTRNYLKKIIFDTLIDAVLCDVQSLPLPEKSKAVICSQIEPTGKHLLSLLSLWHFSEPQNSRKWLTGDMLFECLILNADGLINQRKTAEKILKSRMLDSVVAFRLACINFLETEVLKLWTLVREYILNKIMLEGEKASDLSKSKEYIEGEKYYGFNMRAYTYSRDETKLNSEIDPFTRASLPFTSEREEVLFWIGYCMSKENGISLKSIPHFLGCDFDWNIFSLEFAAFSGNVACFDYFKNFCDSKIEYSYVNIIRKILDSHGQVKEHPCFDRQLPCFAFHYALLNPEEKSELFRDFPRDMLSYFLQWPLSFTILNNLEISLDLFKLHAFNTMFKLFTENDFRQPSNNSLFSLPSLDKNTGIYNTEHLFEIWESWWNISTDSNKSHFLEFYVFFGIENECKRDFETSGLKEKLLRLFLLNGKAIFELYENEYMKESLRSLILKYMPEHFKDLDSQCISIIHPQVEMKNNLLIQPRSQIINEKRTAGPLHGNFLNYIKKYLFSFA